MKKEILELIMLGLQVKEVLTIENLSNALTNLSEKQQLQWVEAMLQDGNESESGENENSNSSETITILKVTRMASASMLPIVKYVKELLDISLKEAKDLVCDNSTFELKVSMYDADQVSEKLQNMKCIVYKN